MPNSSTRLRINRAALRELRERSGMSYRDLADAAGLNHAFVRAIELGDRNPSADSIMKLAEGLRVSLAAITYPLDEAV